jgi:hypothetical protein
LDNPGRIGYGAETVTLGLMRLLNEGSQLSADEQLLASQVALDAVSRSGLLEMVKAQVRAEVLAEQEAAAKAKPFASAEQCGWRHRDPEPPQSERAAAVPPARPRQPAAPGDAGLHAGLVMTYAPGVKAGPGRSHTLHWAAKDGRSFPASCTRPRTPCARRCEPDVSRRRHTDRCAVAVVRCVLGGAGRAGTWLRQRTIQVPPCGCSDDAGQVGRWASLAG